MPKPVTRRAVIVGSVAAALVGLATPTNAGSLDLTNQHTDFQVSQLATGASLVQLIFDLNGWPAGWTYIVRHYCPPGVEMHSQGFAILIQPDGPPIDGLRHYVRLNNMRNLIGDNGEQGFSWYLRNDGDSVGPCRLEISFVARRVV